MRIPRPVISSTAVDREVHREQGGVTLRQDSHNRVFDSGQQIIRSSSITRLLHSIRPHHNHDDDRSNDPRSLFRPHKINPPPRASRNTLSLSSSLYSILPTSNSLPRLPPRNLHRLPISHRNDPANQEIETTKRSRRRHSRTGGTRKRGCRLYQESRGEIRRTRDSRMVLWKSVGSTFA